MSPIVPDEYRSIAFTWCHRAWLVLQFSSYFSSYALITIGNLLRQSNFSG